MVYTPAAAPFFWRMTNRSQLDASAREADRALLPDWSAVTYWLVLVSCSVPAFGRYALEKTPAPSAEPADAARLPLPFAAATTNLPDDDALSLKSPYGFCGRLAQIGWLLGFGRVPIKNSSFVKVLPDPALKVSPRTKRLYSAVYY